MDQVETKQTKTLTHNTQITFRAPDDLRQIIKEAALTSGQSGAAIMRSAVREKCLEILKKNPA